MALSSLFQPQKLAVKKAEAEHKVWRGIFCTFRFLVWEDSKGRIFKNALDQGLLTETAPKKRNIDGTWSRPEYDSDEIAELYRDAWKQFEVEFDKEYIHKGIDELCKLAKDYFGYDKEMLLELNDKRQAAYFDR